MPPPLSLRGWMRYDVVTRMIDRLNPGNVLEIGCGQGAVGARLAVRTAYTGVEPDDESYAVARARIEAAGGVVLQGLHTAVPDGTTFDLVCAFEVLEHIDDDAATLAEWVDLVRPGGHLMLSVPAFQDRFGAWDRYVGHFRRYSPQELVDRLEGAGLKDVQVVVYGWPINSLTEALRNRIAARRTDEIQKKTFAELTASSGRRLQPMRRFTGTLIAVGAVPWRLVQRARPEKGTGIVAVARKPG